MSKSRPTEARQSPSWSGSTALVLLLLPISIVGMVLLAKELYPVDLPAIKDPDFIDIVFDNRGVLWAARLLLVCAAAVLAFGGFFIVISIGMRLRNGEWLRRAGPFEISETTLSEIEGQRDRWRATALLEHEKVGELTERLERSDELIAQLRTAFASRSMVEEDYS